VVDEKMHAANPTEAPNSSEQAESAWAATAEYWAGRIVWALVIATSLWDIAVTFDRPSLLSARLF
jgi:hypothetical protein